MFRNVKRALAEKPKRILLDIYGWLGQPCLLYTKQVLRKKKKKKISGKNVFQCHTAISDELWNEQLHFSAQECNTCQNDTTSEEYNFPRNRSSSYLRKWEDYHWETELRAMSWREVCSHSQMWPAGAETINHVGGISMKQSCKLHLGAPILLSSK